MEHIGSGWRPDGDVVYRRDGDRLIGVMPMHCKRGLHILSAVGCTPQVATRGYPYRDDQKLLRLTCPACRGGDHTWYLVVGQTPDAAEWDDEPYRDIEPLFGERPVERWEVTATSAPTLALAAGRNDGELMVISLGGTSG